METDIAMPPQCDGLVSSADWQTLACALSEHVLHELSLILGGCEDRELAGSIVGGVLEAIPEYSDRAVIVALARVSGSNDRGEDAGAGSSA